MLSDYEICEVGILLLEKASLANQAAENCLRRNKIGYRAFCSELKNLADENKVSRQAVEPEHTEDVPPKVHANIRGKDYYK